MTTRRETLLLLGLAAMSGLTLTSLPFPGLAFTQTRLPLAHAVLLLDGATHSVSVLSQSNVDLRIVAPEYRDLDIANDFSIECSLPPNAGLLSVAARVDQRAHLIPIDIIEYKTYNPTYLKLGVDTIFLRNEIGDDFGQHKLYLDIFAR